MIVDEFNEEDFYETIEAPKFVDLTAPDHRPEGDDRYWFCSRVGQNLIHFSLTFFSFQIRILFISNTTINVSEIWEILILRSWGYLVIDLKIAIFRALVSKFSRIDLDELVFDPFLCDNVCTQDVIRSMKNLWIRKQSTKNSFFGLAELFFSSLLDLKSIINFK